MLTYNGRRYLERTLASLGDCARLLVVDSGSTDGTLELAQAAGAEILHRPWQGTIPQFRFAFDHIGQAYGGGWVVTLDQDEWFSPELQAQVAASLAAPGNKDGFFMARVSYYFDRYIRHGGWYPDRLLRAFRLEAVELAGAPPHEEFRTTGQTGLLQGDIVHHPYADFTEHLAKINSYTQAGAEAAWARGRRGSLAGALLRGAGKFARQYLLQQGFRDGRAGFILAAHGAFYAFQKQLRLLELAQPQNRPDPH